MDQVVIEFVGDTRQMEPAFNILEKLGHIDAETAGVFRKGNEEMAKRVQVVKSVTAEEQKQVKTINDLAKATSALANTAIEEVQHGFAEALQESGVNAEELTDAVEKLGGAEESLKKQLRQMTAELALMEVQGKRNTAEYNELVGKAGELKDAIGDAGDAIANAGSDTRALDNVISLASGVAGGFAVMQGATALFGKESEEVQKILLKVNAAMAILQGLQQIQDLMSKRQFASTAALIGIQRVQAAQTYLQAAAESNYTIVRTAATGAQRLLNAAMAANPIGLAIVAITAVVLAIKAFTSNTNEAEEAQKKLTSEIDQQNKSLETMKGIYDEINSEIDRNTALSVARAKKAGATQQDILGIEQEGIRKQVELMREEQAKIMNADLYTPETAKRYQELTQSIQDAETKLKVDTLNLQTDLNKEKEEKQKASGEKSKDNARRNAQALYEIELRRLQREADLIANFDSAPLLKNLRLEGLEASTKKQEEILNLQKNNELSNDKLTATERLNIANKYAVELEKLHESSAAKRVTIEREYTAEIHKQRLQEGEEHKENVKNFSDQEQKIKEEAEKKEAERKKKKKEQDEKDEEDRLNALKKFEELKKQLLSTGFDVLIQGVNIAFEAATEKRRNQVDKLMQDLDVQRQRELSSKNLTEQQKSDIEKKYKAKEAQIKRAAWEKDKQAQIRQAEINGLLSVSKTFAVYGFTPAAFIAAAGAAASTLLTIAKIKSVDPPAFKHGKIRIDGPGTETSDSILARLSKNESVINARATKKYQPALEAINAMRFDEYLESLMPKVSNEVLSNSRIDERGRLAIDYDKVGRSVARHLPPPNHTEINMDENGFSTHIIEKGNRVKIRNQKFTLPNKR